MRLNDICDLVRSLAYPTTREEPVAEHGDVTIGLQRGDETPGDVLARPGPGTSEGPAEAIASVRTGGSHRAIGRRFYGDRDPVAPGESRPDPVSF